MLGKGHDSNVVYTMDDIPRVYAGFQSCCLESELETVKRKCLSATKDFKLSSIGISSSHLSNSPSTQQTNTKSGVLLSPRAAELNHEIALKYVTSAYDAADEVRNNSTIRLLFEQNALLNATVLHDSYDTLQVNVFPGDTPHPQRSIVYRRMRGGTVLERFLHMRSQMKEKEEKERKRGAKHDVHPRTPAAAEAMDMVYELCRCVLVFLCVSHANGYLHMDIKPDNILIEHDEHQEQQLADGYAVLGDYDVITPMNYLARYLRNHPSYLTGTFGYMSPLLTANDTENRVHGKIHTLARETRAFPAAALTRVEQTERLRKENEERMTSNTTGQNTGERKVSEKAPDASPLTPGALRDSWDAYMLENRVNVVSSDEGTAKVDLQGLGLTVYDFVRKTDKYIMNHFASRQSPQDIRNASSRSRRSTAPNYPGRTDLLRFAARLMFFRPHDFRDARSALQGLTQLRPAFKKNLSVQRALHATPVTYM